MILSDFKADKLNVKVFETRNELGQEAAKEAKDCILNLLTQKVEINILFAAAPSQNEFLQALRTYKLPWNRINALHMDEYIGLSKNASQRFGIFLNKHIFEYLPFKSVNYLFEENSSPADICSRYKKIIKKYPIDIVFMGIGENGHIAFNDPHVALFDDPEMVKLVSLDEVCRKQQVNDGCFAELEDVPKQAVTVTSPVIMSAAYIFCMVPGERKANAVKNTINGPINIACPASILRNHRHAVLYCDKESIYCINN